MIRGIHLNPETYTEWNQPVGTAWFQHYLDPHIRFQVINELKALREVAGLNTIQVFLGAAQDLSWPIPTLDELQRMLMLVSDIADLGMKAGLQIGTPFMIPNSAVRPVWPYWEHVGGHKAGDVVNGRQLWWDVPLARDSCIPDAQDWYFRVLSPLQDWVADKIAYVTLAGIPWLAFPCEMNLLYDGCPYLELAQKYLEVMIPHVRSRIACPVGVSTIPFWGQSDELQYSFLKNLPLASLDVIDISSDCSMKIDEVLSRIGSASPDKIILSDFLLYRGCPESCTKTPSAALAYQLIQMAQTYDLAGWWMWQYKDLAECPGVRERGYFGNEGGWKRDLLTVLS